MQKKIKFNEAQMGLISKSIDEFKNETLKTVARTHFGGVQKPPSHSKGIYTQSYSKYTAIVGLSD
jgi:hypothetical protein